MQKNVKSNKIMCMNIRRSFFNGRRKVKVTIKTNNDQGRTEADLRFGPYTKRRCALSLDKFLWKLFYCVPTKLNFLEKKLSLFCTECLKHLYYKPKKLYCMSKKLFSAFNISHTFSAFSALWHTFPMIRTFS
jgi:hypothetical protein